MNGGLLLLPGESLAILQRARGEGEAGGRGGAKRGGRLIVEGANVSEKACDEGGVRKFSMFADDSLDELAAVAGGGPPEAIADEFSE